MKRYIDLLKLVLQHQAKSDELLGSPFFGVMCCALLLYSLNFIRLLQIRMFLWKHIWK